MKSVKIRIFVTYLLAVLGFASLVAGMVMSNGWPVVLAIFLLGGSLYCFMEEPSFRR